MSDNNNSDDDDYVKSDNVKINEKLKMEKNVIIELNGSKIDQSDQVNENQEAILRPFSYVGFDSLQEQFISRIVNDGFSFNIMVVGITGIGKSTLINSLFNIDFPDNSTKSHSFEKVEIDANYYNVMEGNLKLKLGIIESKGFGDQINKEKSYEPIVSYIDKKFEKYLNDELKIYQVKNLLCEDQRVHVCIYLISPIGNGLHSIDLITMKYLQTKVNIIPVIAKADSLTKEELNELKLKIMKDIIDNEIRIYKFSNNIYDNIQMPFALVTCDDYIKCQDKKIRSRKYTWGKIEIENKLHNDFVYFRDLIFKLNIDDLRETTHSIHYKNYKKIQLEQMGFGRDHGNENITFVEFFKAKESLLIEELKIKENEIKKDFAQKAKIIDEMHRQNSEEKSKLINTSTSGSHFWKNISTLTSPGKKNKK